jgi:hypothetical protein
MEFVKRIVMIANRCRSGNWLVSRMGRGPVVEEDDAVGEGFGGEELDADGAMARLDEGNAFADEDADDVDAELVDFAMVQEGGDDFPAAHHPDMFAALSAEALGKGFDWLVDEFEGG